MIRLHRKKKQMELLKKIFFAWKYHLKPRYNKSTEKCFRENNIIYDIQRYKSKLLARIHKSTACKLRKRNEIESKKLKEINEHKCTLHKLQIKQTEQVEARMKMEKRLLFSEFVDRKIPKYLLLLFSRVDEMSEIYGGAQSTEPLIDPIIHLKEKVKHVIIYTSYTVEGIQLVTTDFVQVNSLLFHGSFKNPAASKEIFELNFNEHLVAMDISATNLIGAVRFYTSKGRVSKWYGKGIVKPFYRVGDKNAAKDVKTDTTITIIGFISRCSADDISGLGVRVRKVIEQKVFMNCFHDININISETEQVFLLIILG